MAFDTDKSKKHIAIIGGGPSALFMFKRLLEAGIPGLAVDIYEKAPQLGSGMPYSNRGANGEHVTNVSDNEIPKLVSSIAEWVKTLPIATLQEFSIDPANFNEFKVLPRLLFGQYLTAQFELLLDLAKKKRIKTKLYLSTPVIDISDKPEENKTCVQTEGADRTYDFVIICTGHHWPKTYEGTIPGYYDSPYPPAKLKLNIDHTVAIRGASLTAIDAIRTLARENGAFEHDEDCILTYRAHHEGFKLIMHSRHGLLPAIRFHLEDSHLSKDALLSDEEIAKHIATNNGFLSLDYIFEKDFKEIFLKKDPEFYNRIKNMSLEEFVEAMMDLRERLDPFQLFKAEYAEAEKSIKRKQSVYWKEMLAILSFAMNYPAKHLSAEDMQRLQKVLMPLISIVIAFVPQNSARELIALHNAGILHMVAVGADSYVEPESNGGITYYYTDEDNQKQSVYFTTFVDCIGQPHLHFRQFPFKNLIEQKVVSPARLKFKSADAGKAARAHQAEQVEQTDANDYYLRVPGITINDNFQVIDNYGAANTRIYIMAVPYIGGYNPDYSGLDFCEAASAKIIKAIIKQIKPS